MEGEHELWNGIRNASKETIRAFFIQFHSEILRVSPQFEFRHGALGNYLFTGAFRAPLRLFAWLRGLMCGLRG